VPTFDAGGDGDEEAADSDESNGSESDEGNGESLVTLEAMLGERHRKRVIPATRRA
jgi:hypothetical protein